MKIENVEVYGLKESIVASGYPMFEKPLSKEIFNQLLFDFEMDDVLHQENRHLKRAIKLGNFPSIEAHDNYLQGIVVQFDVDFTIKAWTEAQRYHFLDFVSSMSTMHKLTKFNLDEAYIGYVDEFIISRMKMLQEEYNVNPSQELKMKLLYSNPVGMKLNARMTTNYRQLKTIWIQRHDHQLLEWREYCDWILTLPYFCELTGISKPIAIENTDVEN